MTVPCRVVPSGAVQSATTRLRASRAEAVSGSGSSGEPSSLPDHGGRTRCRACALVAHGLLQGVLRAGADDGTDHGRGDEDQQQGRQRHPGLDQIGRAAQRIAPPAPECQPIARTVPHPLPRP